MKTLRSIGFGSAALVAFALTAFVPSDAHAPGSAPSRSRSLAGARGGRHAPIAVAWRVKEATSTAGATTSLVLVAEVTRRWNIDVPIRVAVTVPKGLAVASGATSLELAPGPAGTVSSSVLHLRYAAPPGRPLRLTADVQSATFGARMFADYWFAPPPLEHRPLRFGSDLVLGRFNLGPSVRMGD